MSLSHEHGGSKVLAKIKIYILTRVELLFTLCYEIPCTKNQSNLSKQNSSKNIISLGADLLLKCTIFNSYDFTSNLFSKNVPDFCWLC